MRIRSAIASATLVLAGTVGTGVLVDAPAMAKHACTKTSSGTCIKGGQFCPKKKYGQNGWDAKGRRWVCKGDHTHPHWLKP